MKFKILTVTLLALLTGCSTSSNDIFDTGLHIEGANYLSRELDKQELKVEKAPIGASNFPSLVVVKDKVADNVTSKVSNASLGIPLAGSLILAPLKKAVVTSSFAIRTLNGVTKPHNGIDFAAPEGTPIHASGSGEVVIAGDSPSGYGGYGKMVLIQHSDTVRTLYAHMSAIDVVQGTKVTAGQQIGKVGSTGDSTGNHLHLEVRTQESATPTIPGVPPMLSALFVARDPTLFIKELKEIKIGDTVEQGVGKVNN